jgi:hypothetical protein
MRGIFRRYIFSSFRAVYPCIVLLPPVGTGGYSNMALSEPVMAGRSDPRSTKKAPALRVGAAMKRLEI